MFTNSQVLLQRISYKSDLPPAKKVILCLEAGESKAAHLRCLCCSQAADVELGAETGTMWAPAAVKTGFPPLRPLLLPRLPPTTTLPEVKGGSVHCAGGGSSWIGCSGLTRSFWQLTAHATIFRHTAESWTIPNCARKICELIHDFLCNMAIPTDGNNLITIYKPLNFCTVSDNQYLPLWTTQADISLNLATTY